MPLSPAAPRTPLHHRAVDVRGYRRADGLYDIEAQLIDSGTRPFANGWRQPAAPGDALHDMLLRVTIDDRLVVHAVEAASPAHPYPGECGRAAGDYQGVVGLTLEPGFGKALRGLIGEGEGCVHLTELFGPIATVAYITVSLDRAPGSDPEERPRFVGGCRALRLDGPVVARDYPAFARPPRTSSRDGNG